MPPFQVPFARLGTGPRPVRRHVALMALLAMGFVIARAAVTPTLMAQGDSVQYLTLAHTLAHHGVFAFSPDEARPGALAPREPLYPALLAGLMHLDPALNAATTGCFAALGVGCAEALSRLSIVNVILLALAAMAVFGAVLALGGPPWAAWLAGGYLLFNFQAAHDIGWVMSDYLAMALAAAFALTAALAIRWRRAIAWVLPGTALGLLTLTKVAFLSYGLAGLVVLALSGAVALLSGSRRPLAVALSLAVGFLPPVAGWTVRNGIVLDHYKITEGRASETLGYRVAFNDLTPRQIAVGFVYWTRGFGDKLARTVFEPEATHPFNWSGPGDFYETVGESVQRRLVAATATQGGDARAGEAEVTRELLDDIRARPLKHVTTTVLFIYRGIWIDEFIVLGLPLLLVAVWQALRKWQWEMLILLSPGFHGMLFYALFSLNPTRYQLTSLPTVAVGAALGAMYCWQRFRRRQVL